jgi:hypothetical protein
MPVECVYAVIEVKAMLDSNTLKQSFENMESVRRLEKKAYSKDPPYDEFSPFLYGKVWPIWPVNYYLFAFDSVDLKRIASTMNKRYIEENLPIYSRIDTTCVLDKGVICNNYPNGQIDALPSSDSTIINIFTARALLLFYVLICAHLFKAQLPFFQLNDYIRKVSF